jgi:3-methyladenine DNA glycosylase AlkD
MIKNKHHLSLVKLFEQHQAIADNNAWVAHYVGTDKKLYQLATAPKVKLIKTYLKPATLDYPVFRDLLLSLSNGGSFEELSAMGIIMGSYPAFRQQLPTSVVDRLFDHVHGWAEVDITCSFSPEDLLANWPDWQKLLTDFNTDKNIHKRRASLVLLTLPLRDSSDMKFVKLALKNVDRLKSENNILITKAISWVLRSMIKYHPEIVKEYLEKNKNTLPKIAVREVSTKLLTGKKYNRPSKVKN